MYFCFEQQIKTIMYYYSLFIEFVFRIIFFFVLIPFKIVDRIGAMMVSIKFFSSNKDKVSLLYNEAKAFHSSNFKESFTKKMFELSYDYPLIAYWRKFTRDKYHKYILSIMVWSILIVRYTVL